jgi:hypothetical protein
MKVLMLVNFLKYCFRDAKRAITSKLDSIKERYKITINNYK